MECPSETSLLGNPQKFVISYLWEPLEDIKQTSSPKILEVIVKTQGTPAIGNTMVRHTLLMFFSQGIFKNTLQFCQSNNSSRWWIWCLFPSKGKLSTMKRGQDDISQAKRETECGLSFEKFTDVEEGDIVQCYTITVTKQPIDWNWGFWLANKFLFTAN